MKIFLLKRKKLVGYDEFGAMLIVAKNEVRAREIANKHAADEGRIWADAARVSCKIIDGKTEGIVISDFNQG